MQPTTELVFGAPLLLREEGDERVVEVWTPEGKRELKRFSDS